MGNFACSDGMVNHSGIKKIFRGTKQVTSFHKERPFLGIVQRKCFIGSNLRSIRFYLTKIRIYNGI